MTFLFVMKVLIRKLNHKSRGYEKTKFTIKAVVIDEFSKFPSVKQFDLPNLKDDDL